MGGHPASCDGLGKATSLGLTQTLILNLTLSLTFMLTILGDGPGVSPTHRTLWDLGTRSQIQFAKTPQMVVKQTWV